MKGCIKEALARTHIQQGVTGRNWLMSHMLPSRITRDRTCDLARLYIVCILEFAHTIYSSVLFVHSIWLCVPAWHGPAVPEMQRKPSLPRTYGHVLCAHAHSHSSMAAAENSIETSRRTTEQNLPWKECLLSVFSLWSIYLKPGYGHGSEIIHAKRGFKGPNDYPVFKTKE